MASSFRTEKLETGSVVAFVPDAQSTSKVKQLGSVHGGGGGGGPGGGVGDGPGMGVVPGFWKKSAPFSGCNDFTMP